MKKRQPRPRYSAECKSRLPLRAGGYVGITRDKRTKKIVKMCQHRHRWVMTALGCAEKMTRKYVQTVMGE